MADRVKVEIQVIARIEGLTGDERVDDPGGIGDHADCIMEALTNLDGEDPDVTVDLRDGVIVITVTVTGDDVLETTALGFTTIRSAIHECGGATPGWEHIQVERSTATPVRDGHLVGA